MVAPEEEAAQHPGGVRQGRRGGEGEVERVPVEGAGAEVEAGPGGGGVGGGVLEGDVVGLVLGRIGGELGWGVVGLLGGVAWLGWGYNTAA